MPEHTLIGQQGRELYTQFILWNDGHGRYYAYHGAIGNVIIGLYPVLIDGIEKAQNRFYQMKITFGDERPDINRLVKYYFVVKTCTQNHIPFSKIVWSQRVVKPETIQKPRPRKGPEKANTWYLTVFTYQDLFKPVLTRSVDRAWHSQYADSPVPLDFIGYTEYSEQLFETLIQSLDSERHHGNWFVMTPANKALLAGLDFTTDLA